MYWFLIMKVEQNRKNPRDLVSWIVSKLITVLILFTWEKFIAKINKALKHFTSCVYSFVR